MAPRPKDRATPTPTRRQTQVAVSRTTLRRVTRFGPGTPASAYYDLGCTRRAWSVGVASGSAPSYLIVGSTRSIDGKRAAQPAADGGTFVPAAMGLRELARARATPDDDPVRPPRSTHIAWAIALVGLVFSLAACDAQSVKGTAVQVSPSPLVSTSPSAEASTAASTSPTALPRHIQVKFDLKLGAVGSNDEFRLYFALPHVGQTLFGICGGYGTPRPCAGNEVITSTFASDPGGSAPYRIERVDSSGTVQVLASGDIALTADQTIDASYP